MWRCVIIQMCGSVRHDGLVARALGGGQVEGEQQPVHEVLTGHRKECVERRPLRCHDLRHSYTCKLEVPSAL